MDVVDRWLGRYLSVSLDAMQTRQNSLSVPVGEQVRQFEENVSIGISTKVENAPGANVGAFGHGVRGATAQVCESKILIEHEDTINRSFI